MVIKMNYIFTAVILVGACCYGYYYYYGRKKIKEYIIVKLFEELDMRKSEEKVMFKPLRKNQSAMVLFDHCGKQYKICVAYDMKKRVSMLSKKVFLIEDGEKIDITQKPGIPYSLSANEMGGERIIVEKSNKIIREYKGNEVPGYLL